MDIATYAVNPVMEMIATGAGGLKVGIDEHGNSRIISPRYDVPVKRDRGGVKEPMKSVHKKKKKQHKIYKKKGRSR